MSIWDRDKVFAPDGILKQEFPPGSILVLRDARVVVEDFETALGKAPMVHVTVSPIKESGKELVCSILGDLFADRIRDPENGKSLIADGDLPAIVETQEVETDQPQPAFVIRYLDTYSKANEKKWIAQAEAREAGEGDIPF